MRKEISHCLLCTIWDHSCVSVCGRAKISVVYITDQKYTVCACMCVCVCAMLMKMVYGDTIILFFCVNLVGHKVLALVEHVILYVSP